MRVGNTSQSLIAVPDLFYTKDLNEIIAFKKMTKNSNYFTEKNLFKKEVINLSNNNRYNTKKHEEYNKKKYKPLYRLPLLQTEFNKNTPSIKDNTRNRNKDIYIINKSGEIINEPSPYSNEDKKRNFMEKVITLLTDINNGEPKFEIVNPLTDSVEKSFEIKKKNGTSLTERSSLFELDLVKSKFNLVFNQTKESYSKDFLNTIQSKTQEILSAMNCNKHIKTIKKGQVTKSINEQNKKTIKEIKQKLEEKNEKESKFRFNMRNKYSKERERKEKVSIEIANTRESEHFPDILKTEETTKTDTNLKLPLIDFKEENYSSIKSFDSFSSLNYKIYFK